MIWNFKNSYSVSLNIYILYIVRVNYSIFLLFLWNFLSWIIKLFYLELLYSETGVVLLNLIISFTKIILKSQELLSLIDFITNNNNRKLKEGHLFLWELQILIFNTVLTKLEKILVLFLILI